MALIDVHIHVHGDAQLEPINNKLNSIMALIDDLKTEIAALRQASADEKAEVTEALGGLTDTIASLEAQLANGASPEQLQEAIDEVKAAKDEIVGIYNKPTTPTEPTEPQA